MFIQKRDVPPTTTDSSARSQANDLVDVQQQLPGQANILRLVSPLTGAFIAERAVLSTGEGGFSHTMEEIRGTLLKLTNIDYVVSLLNFWLFSFHFLSVFPEVLVLSSL